MRSELSELSAREYSRNLEKAREYWRNLENTLENSRNLEKAREYSRNLENTRENSRNLENTREKLERECSLFTSLSAYLAVSSNLFESTASVRPNSVSLNSVPLYTVHVYARVQTSIYIYIYMFLSSSICQIPGQLLLAVGISGA